MPYQSDTIATVVKRLNAQYFLPAIQREFVWKRDQIIQLFDSIMRGYPISSFLFWEVQPQNRDKWEVYRFIEAFSEQGTHNQLTNTDGVQQLMLVLDGQQRLTSLLIGMKGSYTTKRKYYRSHQENAWIKQHLYLDLLKDPQSDDDGVDIGTRYSFSFSANPPVTPDNPAYGMQFVSGRSTGNVLVQDSQHYWFKVGRILDFDSADRFDDFVDQERTKLPENTTLRQARIFERNLHRLRKAIWEDAVVSYYIEHDQDYDRVLDIFVRANEGGTKLSKSDLLLSMVTAKWSGMNAREEIFSFLHHINYELTRKNNFDKDWLMKACLVLSDLPVQYRVNNFSNKNLALIQNHWEDIKRAISNGIDLVNSFGIDRDTLISANALTPVLYFLYTHPQVSPYHGTKPEDARNASIIRRWLLMAMLNNVFTGASDTTLSDTRRVMQDHRENPIFPADAINAELLKSGRRAEFSEHTIANFLDIEYGDREAFLALSLLYDENLWGTMEYHQDHIFPRAMFSRKELTNLGMNYEQEFRYRRLINRIGNLQLLNWQENEEKSNTPFAEWVATRDVSFKARHLIPDDPELLRFDHFEQFIEAREALIRDRLIRIFAPALVKEATA